MIISDPREAETIIIINVTVKDIVAAYLHKILFELKYFLGTNHLSVDAGLTQTGDWERPQFINPSIIHDDRCIVTEVGLQLEEIYRI